MTRLPAVVMLVLCSCVCTFGNPRGPLPPVCTAPTPSADNPTVVRTGTAVTLRFDFITDCDPPDSFDVSVLDPASGEVDGVTTSITELAATVSFTPTRPGAYHVAARFQPNRGLVQLDVHAAFDRSAEPGGVVIPNGLETYIELTDAGFLVVDNAVFLASNPTVRVKTFGFTPIVRGDVLWVEDSLGLQRWVVDAGALVQFPDSSPVPQSVAELFPSTDDALVLRLDPQLVSVTPSGSWAIRDYPLLPVGGWRHRVHDELIYEDSFGGALCVLPLKADAGTGCVMRTRFEVYMTGDLEGFWLTTGGNAILILHGPGTSSVEVTLPASTIVKPSGVPLVNLGGELELIAVNNGGAIGFEYWGDVVTATNHTVTTLTDAGTYLVRRRD